MIDGLAEGLEGLRFPAGPEQTGGDRFCSTLQTNVMDLGKLDMNLLKGKTTIFFAQT